MVDAQQEQLYFDSVMAKLHSDVRERLQGSSDIVRQFIHAALELQGNAALDQQTVATEWDKQSVAVEDRWLQMSAVLRSGSQSQEFQSVVVQQVLGDVRGDLEKQAQRLSDLLTVMRQIRITIFD